MVLLNHADHGRIISPKEQTITGENVQSIQQHANTTEQSTNNAQAFQVRLLENNCMDIEARSLQPRTTVDVENKSRQEQKRKEHFPIRRPGSLLDVFSDVELDNDSQNSNTSRLDTKGVTLQPSTIDHEARPSENLPMPEPSSEYKPNIWAVQGYLQRFPKDGKEIYSLMFELASQCYCGSYTGAHKNRSLNSKRQNSVQSESWKNIYQSINESNCTQSLLCPRIPLPKRKDF